MVYSGLLNWGEFSVRVSIDCTEYDYENHEWGDDSTYYIEFIPEKDKDEDAAIYNINGNIGTVI